MSNEISTEQITSQSVNESVSQAQNAVSSEAVKSAESAPVNADTANKETSQPKVDSTADKKQEETKVIPEKYEFKLPENSLLDQLAIEEISQYAKEKGYTQEQASELLQRENDAVMDYHQKSLNEHKEQVQKWKNEVMTDKEIGGENFNVNIEYAHRTLQKFATPEFLNALELTGYGNHPDLVKTFVRIGKAMQPDSFIKTSEAPKAAKSYEEIFYGKQ